MAVQTSVSAAPAIGLAGQVASSTGAEFTSRLAEETIAPGLLVVPGDTNPESTCALPDAAGEIDGTTHTPVGFAVLDPYRTSADYTDGESVRIMTRGELFVTVTVAASLVGGKVYVVHATGAVRGTADASATVLPNATFKTATSAGSVGIIQLNGPFA